MSEQYDKSIHVICPGSKWKNKKTGNIYTVTELTCDSEEEAAGKCIRVIYKKPEDTRSWDRPAYLFHQKFEPVEEPPAPAPGPQDILFDQITWLRSCSKALMMQRDDAPGGIDGWAGKAVRLSANMLMETAGMLEGHLAEEVIEENSSKEMQREHG